MSVGVGGGAGRGLDQAHLAAAMHVGKAAARSAQAQGRTTAGEGGGRRGARGGPHKGGPGGGGRGK